MDVSQEPGRELYNAIHRHKVGSLYEQVLLPWADANEEEVNGLRGFAARPGAPFPTASIGELWELYALSRANETLLLRFQTGRADGTDWPGPEITVREYTAFWERLGLTVDSCEAFTPFCHEIVEVEPAPDPDAPIEFVGAFWPCLMLGPLLFSRAGVWVTGGANHIAGEIAETSTLYWAYRRKNRVVQDLSRGWGSNSQWRTSFRRDYWLDGRFWYNVDGNNNLAAPASPDRDGLTTGERIELLTHRCFITSPHPHDDLWPYDDVWSELDVS